MHPFAWNERYTDSRRMQLRNKNVLQPGATVALSRCGFVSTPSGIFWDPKPEHLTCVVFSIKGAEL